MTADEQDQGWRGRWPGRVLRFPVTRIVLAFLAILAIGNLARVLVGALYGPWRVTSLARAATIPCAPSTSTAAGKTARNRRSLYWAGGRRETRRLEP